VTATCALGVLGAGFAGIASAQTTPRHPHAAVQHAPQFAGVATTVTRRAAPPAPIAATNRRHRPQAPSSPTPADPAPTSSAAPPAADPVPSTSAPTPAATTPPAADTVIDQVLAHINAARTQNGLQPYTLSADLSRASAAHTELMINGCGLSHQCPGEPSLGDRFTAQGVPWTSAGENIGYGSAGSSEAAIVAAANGLTDSMLAEVPPNDGHRRNLLSPGFRHIGLAVVRDSKGLVWMTQDFVN
jgi:uncharacterized protein YkwD